MHTKTLQKMVIKDTQYLMYYLKKHKKEVQEYKDFCSLEQFSQDTDDYIETVLNDYAIDLWPYLYTVHMITSTEFNSFLIYYVRHASSSDIDVDTVSDYFANKKNITTLTNIAKLLSITKKDPLILISLLSVMQYYFI